MNRRQYMRVRDMVDRQGVYRTPKCIYIRAGVGGSIWRIHREQMGEMRPTIDWIMRHGIEVREPREVIT